MKAADGSISKTWRMAHGDLTDEEWALITDLSRATRVLARSAGRRSGNKRDIVNAIFYVAATGCQWRALPSCLPAVKHCPPLPRHLVRGRHLGGDLRGLAELVRIQEGRDPEASAGVVDARSVRGALTVTRPTRGYDAGKKISGRKTFGIVDTMGLLIAVVVLAASVSDNSDGIEVLHLAESARVA